jgi:hypothetical protein
MTTSETPESARTQSGPSAPARRSPALIAAIVIVVVVVLAGGAYVVYKLTDKKDVGEPAYKVAKTVLVAAQQGNKAVIVKNTTGGGARQVEAFTASSLGGMKVSKCSPFAGSKPTRVCVYTRPGGQLTLRLVRADNRWKVDAAVLVPTAVTPTSGVTTTTT